MAMNILTPINQDMTPRLRAYSITDFVNLELPPRELILSPWLPSQGLGMIYAPRGIGKTHVSLGIAHAVANGTSFLGWEPPKPRGVLFVDGEMPGNLLQERLKGIMGTDPIMPLSPLTIITQDQQIRGIPDLASEEGQLAINEHITDDIELIIFDNLSTLFRSGKENDAESWAPVQNWALTLRAMGKSVLFIHHSGKSGAQRGTSRKEDVLDTVIALRRSTDYTPEQGACFEVHFEKSRGIHGEDIAPFRAQLISDENTQTWNTDLLDDSNYERTITLLKEGLSQSDVAKELNLNKSTISRYARNAKQDGRISPE